MERERTLWVMLSSYKWPLLMLMSPEPVLISAPALKRKSNEKWLEWRAVCEKFDNTTDKRILSSFRRRSFTCGRKEEEKKTLLLSLPLVF